MIPDSGLQRLHLANDDTVNWLEQTAVKDWTKWSVFVNSDNIYLMSVFQTYTQWLSGFLSLTVLFFVTEVSDFVERI